MNCVLQIALSSAVTCGAKVSMPWAKNRIRRAKSEVKSTAALRHPELMAKDIGATPAPGRLPLMTYGAGHLLPQNVSTRKRPVRREGTCEFAHVHSDEVHVVGKLCSAIVPSSGITLCKRCYGRVRAPLGDSRARTLDAPRGRSVVAKSVISEKAPSPVRKSTCKRVWVPRNSGVHISTIYRGFAFCELIGLDVLASDTCDSVSAIGTFLSSTAICASLPVNTCALSGIVELLRHDLPKAYLLSTVYERATTLEKLMVFELCVGLGRGTVPALNATKTKRSGKAIFVPPGRAGGQDAFLNKRTGMLKCILSAVFLDRLGSRVGEHERRKWYAAAIFKVALAIRRMYITRINVILTDGDATPPFVHAYSKFKTVSSRGRVLYVPGAEECTWAYLDEAIRQDACAHIPTGGIQIDLECNLRRACEGVPTGLTPGMLRQLYEKLGITSQPREPTRGSCVVDILTMADCTGFGPCVNVQTSESFHPSLVPEKYGGWKEAVTKVCSKVAAVTPDQPSYMDILGPVASTPEVLDTAPLLNMVDSFPREGPAKDFYEYLPLASSFASADGDVCLDETSSGSNYAERVLKKRKVSNAINSENSRSSTVSLFSENSGQGGRPFGNAVFAAAFKKPKKKTAMQCFQDVFNDDNGQAALDSDCGSE